MANTKTCWKCYRQGCSLTAWLLLSLTTCRFLMNTTASYECWILSGFLWLVQAAAFVTIIVIIARLFSECTWYDEKLEEEHCHLRDTREKMQRENLRMLERLNAEREETRGRIEEIRARILLIWNGGL